MAVTRDEVRHVAQLARLSLSPDEEARYADQLSHILGYVERLQALDVSGVEPMSHAVPLPAPERPDEVRPGLTREEALAGAPQALAQGFAVPRIIE